MLNIKQRQLNLKHLGYHYKGKIDGVEGPLLKDAYGKLQKSTKLVADKIYGPLTDKVCIEKVKALQKALNAHGANITVDGLVGDKTIAAIKTFQQKNRLVADGIAGEKTLSKLIAPKTISWDDIKHFKKSEFRCPCGKCNGFPVAVDMNLVKLLDNLRSYFGVPITVTSGVRCENYNKVVGGIKTSEHLKGKAADIYVPGIAKETVKKKAIDYGAKYSYYGTPGMGNAVHINI